MNITKFLMLMAVVAFIYGCNVVLPTDTSSTSKTSASITVKLKKENQIEERKLTLYNDIKAYYTIENGKFYARVFYNSEKGKSERHAPLVVVYLVGENSTLRGGSGYMVEVIHRVNYISRMTIEKISLNFIENEMYHLSVKLKGRASKRFGVKWADVILDNIQLAKLVDLESLKKMDNIWEFAKENREKEFREY